MSVYKGKTVAVQRAANEISDKFSDLTQLKSYLDKVPDEYKGQVPPMEFGHDYLAVDTGQVGQLKFQVVDRTPNRVVFKGVGTPVPVSLNVALTPKGAQETEVASELDIELPMMLRAFVGPQIQKAVDQISDLIAKSVSH